MNNYKELIADLRSCSNKANRCETCSYYLHCANCLEILHSDAADAMEQQRAEINRLTAENRSKEQYIAETIGKLASERERDDEIIASLQKELVEAAKERDAAMPVRHGHWIGVYDTTHGVKYKLNNIHECSVCRDQFEFIVKSNHNYCPNCGAKMDEASE